MFNFAYIPILIVVFGIIIGCIDTIANDKNGFTIHFYFDGTDQSCIIIFEDFQKLNLF